MWQGGSKINDMVKSAQLFVKGGSYDDAEADIKRALSACNEIQKPGVINKIKEFYFAQANEFIAKDKRKNAAEVYERLLDKNLSPNEKRDIQTKLLNIYNALGRISDYQRMKKSLNVL